MMKRVISLEEYVYACYLAYDLIKNKILFDKA